MTHGVRGFNRLDASRGSLRLGLWSLSALLFLGAVLCMLGMEVARRRDYESAELWFALSAITMWFGALLCAALKLYRSFQRSTREQHTAGTSPMTVDAGTEYTAEYSYQDRGSGLGLMLFFGTLTTFLAIRSTHSAVVITLCAVGTCVFLWYSLHLMITRIQFTSERISARLPLFRRISKPYMEIVDFQS